MSDGSDERAFIRWVPEEWRKVAAAALSSIDRGKDIAVALISAQKVLPPPRRRDADEIYRISKQNAVKRYIDEARLLTPEELARLVPPKPERPPRAAPLKPRPKMDEGRDYNNGMVRWTMREKARLARQITTWREAGDKRALSRLIIEAQEVVIDEDRRRPPRSIQAGAASGHNKELLKEGTANIWLLLDEDRKATEAMIAAAEAAEAVEAQQPAAGAAPVQAFTAQAAPIAATRATSPPAPATPGAQPDTTSPARTSLSEAARAFGDTVMGALDKLLAVHAQTVLDAVNARISTMATQTSLEIAAMIEQGMRRTVHSLVENELGGPVGAHNEAHMPAEPPPEEPPPAAQEEAMLSPETPRAPTLKVDVVGLHHGGMEQQVRQAFNGNTDLRFFRPESSSSYEPHRGRHCVLVAERVPHKLTYKITSAGIEPVLVRSTPRHVIQAIEELHRSTGIAAH